MAAVAGKGWNRIAGPARRIAPVVFVLLAVSAHGAAEGPFYLNASDRVVFYGGAPPLGQLDTAVIETYVATRFPKMDVEFLHRGWDGRWSRPGTGDGGPAEEILGLRPTAVVMGAVPQAAGDGRDLPDYTAAYTDLVKKLKAASPALRITLAAPGPRSEAGHSDAVFRTLAKDEGVLVHQAEPLPSGAPGNPAASVKAALDLLRSWNAPATVSVVEISALGKAVVRSENTTVRELEAERVVAWSQDDATLPLPSELSAAGGAALAQINIELVRVTGLISGRYKLTIDGWLMGIFDRDDFERGIDLTKLPTPMLKQAAQVFDLTVNHVGIQHSLWELAQGAGNDARARELEKTETEALERRRNIGEPRTHDYEIVPVQ